MPNSNPNPLSTPSSSSALAIRDYRKGNWTIQETLTLITAKRLDDDRRSQSRSGRGPASSTPRSAAELRWKWIENYCCANGCLRSQNQCNDKWDNLLRDYKKLSSYQQYSQQQEDSKPKPYWEMDKQERKDKGLPTNLSAEVFDALTDVLSRRSANRSNQRKVLIPVALVSNSQHQQNMGMEVDGEMEKKAAVVVAEPTAVPAVPTPPAPPPPMSTYQAPPMSSQPYTACAVRMSESSDSAEPDQKRRRVRDTGSTVVRGASIVARTLLACEEKQEKRHRDLIELQERRFRIEADRAEMDRQGLGGLMSAVKSISNAIQAFVSHRDGPSTGNAR